MTAENCVELWKQARFSLKRANNDLALRALLGAALGAGGGSLVNLMRRDRSRGMLQDALTGAALGGGAGVLSNYLPQVYEALKKIPDDVDKAISATGKPSDNKPPKDEKRYTQSAAASAGRRVLRMFGIPVDTNSSSPDGSVDAQTNWTNRLIHAGVVGAGTKAMVHAADKARSFNPFGKYAPDIPDSVLQNAKTRLGEALGIPAGDIEAGLRKFIANDLTGYGFTGNPRGAGAFSREVNPDVLRNQTNRVLKYIGIKPDVIARMNPAPPTSNAWSSAVDALRASRKTTPKPTGNETAYPLATVGERSLDKVVPRIKVRSANAKSTDSARGGSVASEDVMARARVQEAVRQLSNAPRRRVTVSGKPFEPKPFGKGLRVGLPVVASLGSLLAAALPTTKLAPPATQPAGAP